MADPYESFVTAMLFFEGTDGSQVFDNSKTGGWPFEVGLNNPQIDTADFKEGSSSLLIPDDNSYLVTTPGTDDRLNGGDFCNEAWLKPTLGATKFWYEHGLNQADGQMCAVSTSEVRWRTNGVSDLVHAAVISDFVHVAHVYESAHATEKKRLYVGGVKVATANIAVNPSSLAQIRYGSSPSAINSFRFQGWIDGLRITKGHHRYSANFTPPITAADYGYDGGASLGWAKRRHKLIS